MARSTVRSAARSLPVSLAVRILFGGSGQLGWVLVAFSMVFVWIFDAGACEPRIGDRGELVAGRPGPPTALHLLMPGLSVVTLARYVVSIGG